MNIQLQTGQHNLTLRRYPPKLQHASLQAWDAADEYLLQHITDQFGDNMPTPLCVLNDDFGTLGCALSAFPLYWQSDSRVAHLALHYNLAQNQLSADRITVLDSLTPIPKESRVILLKLPKTLGLLEYQLQQINQSASPDITIIAAGKTNLVQTATLKLFEKYIGTTRTSLAVKKSRLVFSTFDTDKRYKSTFPEHFQCDINGFEISNHANVFARQQLDIGARLFMQHLPNAQDKHVIDLGCGNGVIGLQVLNQSPDASVTFVDESHMSVASARANVERNLAAQYRQCQFIEDNCLEHFDSLNQHGAVDVVLCNPPFHQQNTITDHIAFQMFSDAKRVLRKGGELRIIGNRHLDYPRKLKRLFGGYRVVASDKKFSILSAIKRD
ncbi:methyltransferase [Aestuariibacter salexigens]|uniref:methyltransferase n=1 Tax=Aestuariibacter salexigens TaxID=226010 RepID=UPI0003FB3A9B|nr:methyltransferase [Aestuariibacter salexigens]